jgi:hypothetical protein
MELFRKKNTATYIFFPIYNSNGDFLSGAAGLDSETTNWADGSAPGSFADCTNEATEVGTTGWYYLSLTAGEMNFDYIAIQVKTTTTGAKTRPIIIQTKLKTDLDAIAGYIDTEITAIYDRIGAPAGASVSADVAAVKAETASIQSDTNDIQTRLPAALVSGRIDASVGAVAANAITATAIATGAITAAKFAAGAIDAAAIADGAIDAGALAADAITAAKLAADVTTELQSGLATAAALDAVDNFIDTEVAAIKAVTDKLDTAVELDGSVYRFTTNALEQAPTGGSAPSAATIADAVWDEARADHATAGSFGQGAASVQGNVTGSIGSLATQAKADVNAEADTALSDVGVTTTVTGRIDAAVTTRAAASVLGSPAGASVSADIASVKSDTAAVKLKTDNLPADPADASDIAAATAAIEADTQDIQSRLPAALVGGRMDASVGAMAANTVTAAAVAADVTTELQSGLATAAALTTVEGKVDTLLTADVAYKKNVAVTAFAFYMELTDGSPGTGLTVAGTISKDGGAFASLGASVSEISAGWYKVNIAQAEMNADEVALKFTATGAKQRNIKIRTQA